MIGPEKSYNKTENLGDKIEYFQDIEKALGGWKRRKDTSDFVEVYDWLIEIFNFRKSTCICMEFLYIVLYELRFAIYCDSDCGLIRKWTLGEGKARSSWMVELYFYS